MYMKEHKGEVGQPYEIDDGGDFITAEAKGLIEVPHDKAVLWYLSRIATALEKIAAKSLEEDLRDSLSNVLIDVRINKPDKEGNA